MQSGEVCLLVNGEERHRYQTELECMYPIVKFRNGGCRAELTQRCGMRLSAAMRTQGVASSQGEFYSCSFCQMHSVFQSVGTLDANLTSMGGVLEIIS